MAGAEGFEPPNARTKTWCLTTWRRPNMNCYDLVLYYLLLWHSMLNPAVKAVLYSPIIASSIILRSLSIKRMDYISKRSIFSAT